MAVRAAAEAAGAGQQSNKPSKHLSSSGAILEMLPLWPVPCPPGPALVHRLCPPCSFPALLPSSCLPSSPLSLSLSFVAPSALGHQPLARACSAARSTPRLAQTPLTKTPCVGTTTDSAEQLTVQLAAMAPKKRVPPAEDPETPCAVETPVPKRLSGTKKSPEQKQTELEALMLLSPRSKEKALARKAAYAAGALKSAETRKRKAAEAAAAAAAGTAAAVAPAAAAGAEVPGQETRSPVAAAAAAAAPTPVSTSPGTPPPGGQASSAGRGSRRGGAQVQG